jgi:hypothetical protein
MRRYGGFLLLLMLGSPIGCGDHETTETTPRLGTGEFHCDITFGVTNATRLNNVQAVVDYEATDGDFVGFLRDLECEPLVNSALVDVVDYGRCDRACRPELAISVMTQQDVDAPLDLVRCAFVARKRPKASQFRPRLMDYAADAEPQLAATRVSCSLGEDTPSASTSTSTTSTVVSECTQACGEFEECIDGECIGIDDYSITFSVADAQTFGALTVYLRHDCGLGRFVGDGAAVDCEFGDFNALPAFNNDVTDTHPCDPRDREALQFAAGFISTTGVRTPADLFTCRFRSNGGVPAPEDFRIEVPDATDVDGAPLWPWPTVTVRVGLAASASAAGTAQGSNW